MTDTDDLVTRRTTAPPRLVMCGHARCLTCSWAIEHDDPIAADRAAERHVKVERHAVTSGSHPLVPSCDRDDPTKDTTLDERGGRAAARARTARSSGGR